MNFQQYEGNGAFVQRSVVEQRVVVIVEGAECDVIHGRSQKKIEHILLFRMTKFCCEEERRRALKHSQNGASLELSAVKREEA
jgi:hypothetical protein